MNVSRIARIALLVFLVLPLSAHAGVRERIIHIQRAVEERLTPLIRAYDPLGVVLVKLEPKTEEQALPMTPFVVSNAPVADTEGNPEFKTYEIIVLTRKKQIPESVLSIVRETAANMGLEPTLRVEVVPGEETEKESLADAGALGDRQPASEPPVDTRTWWQRFFEDTLSKPAALVLMLGALGLLAELSILFWGWLSSRTRRMDAAGLARVLEGGFTKLSTALEGGGLGNATRDRDARDAQISASSQTPTQVTGESNAFANLPAESLVAMLSDCYWSESDGYAAYIWRRIPIAVRRVIVKEVSWLSDYASYLSGLSEENLGADQEPYYLSPLAIAHLDNATLTTVVRKFPGLYSRLPTLRVNFLKLTIKERIDFGQRRIAMNELPDMSSMKASTERRLKSRARLSITDVSEETQILMMRDFPRELRGSVPTLGWLAMLPDSAIVEVLKHFSAKDLASAWIGPDEVLRRLSSCVPQRKLELMTSYRNSVVASRSSAAFRKLHELGVKGLQEHEMVKRNDQAAA